MKIALVHDWLNQKFGGAENVLAQLASIYPDAPIFTMIYNPELFDYPKERIHTSNLQSAPKYIKQRSRYLLPLIPNAIESWDFSEFDVVLSSSCAFTKNIITPDKTTHISYCHSPMRFAWDYWPRYLDEQNIGPIRRLAIRKIVKDLRIWDYAGAARVDHFIANSQTTADRIEKYYRRQSQIIYPPVNTQSQEMNKEDYFVTLGMLTPYKKIDLAIEAFNISGRKLKIIGDGPDRKRLENMAEDNIEFIGFTPQKKKIELLGQAKALIFPNIEDFGIAPVEAMAAGTPVIAYNRGGATETVLDGVTGVLFDQQSAKSLNQAVAKIDSTEFIAEKLHKQADRFNSRQFNNSIIDFVNRNVN